MAPFLLHTASVSVGCHFARGAYGLSLASLPDIQDAVLFRVSNSLPGYKKTINQYILSHELNVSEQTKGAQPPGS